MNMIIINYVVNMIYTLYFDSREKKEIPKGPVVPPEQGFSPPKSPQNHHLPRMCSVWTKKMPRVP